jgi:hypothetical protein
MSTHIPGSEVSKINQAANTLQKNNTHHAFIDSLKNAEGLIVEQNKSSQFSKGMKDLADFSLESFKENLSH